MAGSQVAIVLGGETGTGKEVLARAIHRLSGRPGEFVATNCAALPATLVESELFGYEAGAFTGAERKGRKGKIEQADGGTLFFDEVGDMPAEVQVKLLRVLQDGSFQRVGGNEIRRSDFRLISASNRNFEAMIAEGTFRLDLFFRIRRGVLLRGLLLFLAFGRLFLSGQVVQPFLAGDLVTHAHRIEVRRDR